MLAGAAPHDASRAERFERWLPADSFPSSYSQTTEAEAQLQTVTELFRTQYHEYYPNRAPLLLTPFNECNSRKMMCTFIKPTIFPFEGLFDLPSCAKFFAGYMRYEPLEDPEVLPKVVVSPATTLQWQTGNCFELSLLLASVLTGAGYNAYVVIGYAHQFICNNDYSQREWNDSENLFEETESDGEEEVEPELNSEYAALVKERPILRGVNDPEPFALQQQQQEQLLNDKQKSQLEQQESGLASGSQTGMERIAGGHRLNSRQSEEVKLLHSWVLVLPGGRKSQKDAVFVEPASGELIPPHEADTFYTGIEAVFNTHNYQVNLAPNTPVSSLTLDLNDSTQWEGIVLDLDPDDERDASLFAATISGGAGGDRDRLNHSVTLNMRWRTHGGGGAGDGIAQGAANSLPAAAATINVLAFSLREKSARPGFMSWVKELTLSRAQFESRYPGGAKVIHYSNAEVRWYAAYAMPDLRVMEVRLPDTKYFKRQQVHILFKHRADKLRRRSLYPTENGNYGGLDGDDSNNANNNSSSVSGGGFGTSNSGEAYRLLKEWFERGRMRDAAVEGLRLFTHEPGIMRSMTFYWDARDDGLWRRQEIFYEGQMLRKVKEFYRRRDDRLWYRSASFERSSANSFIRAGRRRSSLFTDRPREAEAQRLEPVRVSEKYRRSEIKNSNEISHELTTEGEISPDEDVAKYTFVRSASGGGEMWVYFHYRPNSIVRPYRMYDKGARGEEYLAAAAAVAGGEAFTPPPCRIVCMPNSEPPSELEQYNERKRLAWWENICLGRVRAMMEECNSILDNIRAGRFVTISNNYASPLSSSSPPYGAGMLQSSVTTTTTTNSGVGTGVRAEISVFDTLRNRPRETEAERARKLAEAAAREASRRDYLAPYIAKLELPRSFDGDYMRVVLTAEQARQVRDEALRELKERLIQRGHIMQAQMDAEKEDFNRRQAAYQNSTMDTNTGIDTGRDEEEFAQYCKEATWRMKTLDERLAKHIDLSSEKYAKLAQRLAEDPRLAALYKPQI